jgi:hypothetical protein
MSHVIFPSLEKKRDEQILLTQKVYTRLCGLINLCAFHIGTEKEYGEYIFGCYRRGKILFYDHNTKVENIAGKACEWKPSKEMIDEADERMEVDGFNCYANVHTHPSITASGLAFSEEDIRYYKHEKAVYEIALKKGITKEPIRTFGCMMSVGPRQYGDDAIAFVSWENGELFYYPNISVIIDDVAVPLKEAPLRLYVDDKNVPHLVNDGSCNKIIIVKRNIMI